MLRGLSCVRRDRPQDPDSFGELGFGVAREREPDEGAWFAIEGEVFGGGEGDAFGEGTGAPAIEGDGVGDAGPEGDAAPRFITR